MEAMRRPALTSQRIVTSLILIALGAASFPAEAHETDLSSPDLLLAAAIAVSICLYVVGTRNLWVAAPGHRAALPRYAAPFVLGWAILTMALLPPLAPISAQTFSGH